MKNQQEQNLNRFKTLIQWDEWYHQLLLFCWVCMFDGWKTKRKKFYGKWWEKRKVRKVILKNKYTKKLYMYEIKFFFSNSSYDSSFKIKTLIYGKVFVLINFCSIEWKGWWRDSSSNLSRCLATPCFLKSLSIY